MKTEAIGLGINWSKGVAPGTCWDFPTMEIGLDWFNPPAREVPFTPDPPETALAYRPRPRLAVDLNQELGLAWEVTRLTGEVCIEKGL